MQHGKKFVHHPTNLPKDLNWTKSTYTVRSIIIHYTVTMFCYVSSMHGIVELHYKVIVRPKKVFVTKITGCDNSTSTL